MTLLIENRYVEAGEEFSIQVGSDDNRKIRALQLGLDWSNLEFIGIESGSLDIVPGQYIIEDQSFDQFALVWTDKQAKALTDQLFTLRLRARESASLKDLISIGKTEPRPLVYFDNYAEAELELEFIYLLLKMPWVSEVYSLNLALGEVKL